MAEVITTAAVAVALLLALGVALLWRLHTDRKSVV